MKTNPEDKDNSTQSPFRSCSFPFHHTRQRETEGAPFSHALRFHPDPAAAGVDDPFHEVISPVPVLAPLPSGLFPLPYHNRKRRPRCPVKFNSAVQLLHQPDHQLEPPRQFARSSSFLHRLANAPQNPHTACRLSGDSIFILIIFI